MTSNTSAQSAREIWSEYCESLKQAGDSLLVDALPGDERSQAEGLRYLSRLGRAGIEWFLEYADPEFPVLYRPAHESLKMGMDNPDSYYQKCVLSGRHRYRIRGRRNTIDYLSFTTSKGSYAENATQITTGFISGPDLEMDEQGCFEILLSVEPQPGNWLPMEADTESLLIRQNFKDRDNEVPAELSVERLDAGALPAPLTLQDTAAGLQRAASFVANTAALFGPWPREFESRINRFEYLDQTPYIRIGGDPKIIYYMSGWQLAEDEVLLVEIDHVPECEAWNFQLANHWMESLDYRYAQVHVNQHTAQVSDDGSVRLVVAAVDPGVPNWINTTGHTHGGMCWRWIGCKDPVHPQARVVKLADL